MAASGFVWLHFPIPLNSTAIRYPKLLHEIKKVSVYHSIPWSHWTREKSWNKLWNAIFDLWCCWRLCLQQHQLLPLQPCWCRSLSTVCAGLRPSVNAANSKPPSVLVQHQSVRLDIFCNERSTSLSKAKKVWKYKDLVRRWKCSKTQIINLFQKNTKSLFYMQHGNLTFPSASKSFGICCFVFFRCFFFNMCSQVLDGWVFNSPLAQKC